VAENRCDQPDLYPPQPLPEAVVFFSQLQSQDEDGDAPEQEFPAAESVTDEVQDDERHEFVEAALRALPEHQRVPLVLFHFEEMAYEEIAAKLSISLPR